MRCTINSQIIHILEVWKYCSPKFHPALQTFCACHSFATEHGTLQLGFAQNELGGASLLEFQSIAKQSFRDFKMAFSPYTFSIQTAMSSVYGPFDGPDTWTPPQLKNGVGRNLRTDAYAIINFITLSRFADDQLYLEYAQILIHTVHETLGRTNDGSMRLRGATDDHPLRGGLRTGESTETGAAGDGQSYHYLSYAESPPKQGFILNFYRGNGGPSGYGCLL